MLSELPAHLEAEFGYPVELDTVFYRMGDLEVVSQEGTDSETLGSIHQPLGTDTFDSATMLYETVYWNVSDDYIGWKYYDDRGANVSPGGKGLGEEVNISFWLLSLHPEFDDHSLSLTDTRPFVEILVFSCP